MERGYLKLWRKSLDSEVFASEQLWILWSWCLMKASHKDRFVKFHSGKGNRSVPVTPGQFVFGRNKAADVFGWSPSTTWNRLQKLAEIGCLLVESNNQYSIITICNWKIYQPDEKEKLTTNEQPTDNQLTTNEQPIDTNKNVKNEENVKNALAAKKAPRIKFQPPTIEEIYSYCQERQNSVDPQKWHDYYSSKGWMIGKNKMVCWISAVRTWESNDFPKKSIGFQTKHSINDEIQNIGEVINGKTGFSPYREIETGNRSGNANKDRRSLPE